MVQLSLASAAAIAIAVPLFSLGVPPPELVLAPYAATFTASDLLKRTDALLIAILTKREELQCPPHHECAIQNDQGDTLTDLRSVRKQVESEAITEEEGIRKLTKLLDGLCPVSDPGLHRLSDEGS